jgi:prevent-host-death family protein
MAQFNIEEAKARFPELVERALAGDDVVIVRGNRPLLKLIPLTETGRARKPGTARGQIWMSDDFDEPFADFDKYR